jgi:integrase
LFAILLARSQVMGVKVRNKNGNLYLDIYSEGNRKWEALHLSLGGDKHMNRETLRLAEIIRQKRELQIASGEWGLLDPIEGKKAVRVYAEEYARERPPKDHMRKSLKYIEEYFKDMHIGAVSERTLEGYQQFLFSKGLSKGTVVHYWAVIKQLLRRAVRDRVIPRNPAEAVKGVSTPESLKVHLSPGEISSLAATPVGGTLGAEVKRAFLFGVLTGLRVSDLRGLLWGDIGGDPPQIARRQVKTGRVVNIPLHDSAWKIINDSSLHKHDEPVFPTLSETKTNTNQYLVAWAKKAGIDKQIGWHTARHTFAVLTLEGGADFYTVSKLLGHTKPQTTAGYAKATDKMRRAAVNGLPEITIEQVGNGNEKH